jgi:cell division protein FtsZ
LKTSLGAKQTLKLSDAKLAMNTIRAHTSHNADFIYGTNYEDNLKGVRVTLMVTGL